MTTRLASLGLMLLSVAPVWAHAQDSARASVAVRADLVAAEPTPGAVLGGSATFVVTNRVAVEAAAAYFTRIRWASALSATGSVLIAVGPSGWSDRVVWYVVGGAGLHRARVDVSGNPPAFYARRIDPSLRTPAHAGETRAFNDAATIVGAGVRFAAGRIVMQPEVRVWIVTAGGETRTSALFGTTIGFGF